MTKAYRPFLSICLAMILTSSFAIGQSTSTSSASAAAVVPRLMNYSGTARDAEGKPITQIAGATFSIYSQESGGSSLWMETQNIHPDAKGNFSIQLGASKPDGLPMSVFASGEARWLGVRINGGEEQPRALLLSVPYALKAADAETVGGLPASAFMLAAPVTSGAALGVEQNGAVVPQATGTTPVTTAGGTANQLAKFDATADITKSIIFDNGTNVGVGNTKPSAKLDVSGSAIVRGLLNMPAIGAATATTGKNSQPFGFTTSAFNSGTGTAVNQNFRWQAEPTGNNTASASGTLNLLHSQGSNTPAETGLKIASNGQVTFASGQKFPGAGTVSSVGLTAPSSDFSVSGSPVSGSGTLALNWTVAPASSDVANAIVKRDANGFVNVTAIDATTTISGLTAMEGTSNAGMGVAGISNSTYGVFGNGITGVYGAGTSGYGVYGIVSSSGIDGLHGESGSGNSGVAGLNSAGGYGVYGQSRLGYAIWGEVTGASGLDAVHGYTLSNDGAGVSGVTNQISNFGLYSYSPANTNDSGWSAYFDGPDHSCGVRDGNLYCTGSKSSVVPVDKGSRQVALYAVEAPDNWFEDFGSGRLSNGQAEIRLEPIFSQTVNTAADYHVFLTPRGDCEGLYVAETTSGGFTVRELHHGSSSIAFDYRIVARRKGYESVRLADLTKPFSIRKPTHGAPAPTPLSARSAALPGAATMNASKHTIPSALTKH